MSKLLETIRRSLASVRQDPITEIFGIGDSKPPKLKDWGHAYAVGAVAGHAIDNGMPGIRKFAKRNHSIAKALGNKIDAIKKDPTHPNHKALQDFGNHMAVRCSKHDTFQHGRNSVSLGYNSPVHDYMRRAGDSATHGMHILDKMAKETAVQHNIVRVD